MHNHRSTFYTTFQRETLLNLLQKRQHFIVEGEQMNDLAESAVVAEEEQEEQEKQMENNEDDQEDDEEEMQRGDKKPKKSDKPNKVVAGPRKVVRSQREIAQDVAKLDTLVSGTTIQDRIPKRSHHKLHTSTYYMNNRKKFIRQLVPLFKKYSEDLQSGKQPSRGDIFEPMIHQQVIRDYLNLYTPYRGLLLFMVSVRENMFFHCYRRRDEIAEANLCTDIGLSKGKLF